MIFLGRTGLVLDFRVIVVKRLSRKLGTYRLSAPPQNGLLTRTQRFYNPVLKVRQGVSQISEFRFFSNFFILTE